MTQTTRSIKTYTALSMDGFVSGPDGRPSHLSLPTYEPGKTHGFREFQAGCGAVAMGRTTFEPALANPWWPWPDLRVYVLSEHELPEGTPDEVVRIPGVRGPSSTGCVATTSTATPTSWAARR